MISSFTIKDLLLKSEGTTIALRTPTCRNPQVVVECNVWLYISLELLWQNLISTLVRLVKAAFPSGFLVDDVLQLLESCLRK